MSNTNLGRLRDEYSAALQQIHTTLTELQVAIVTMTTIRDTYAIANSIEQGYKILTSGHRPMWPAEPTSLQWTDRNGRGRYLYYYWRIGEGPNGQRKTYIGTGQPDIALAEMMTANHRHHRQLTAHIRDLANQLQGTTNTLSSEARYLTIALARAHRAETETEATTK